MLSTVLGDRARWIILRELARHGQLPLSFLAARAGIKAPTASQHMQVLKKAGVVVKAMGRLYRLHPSLQPPPGAEFLDLGPALIRLPE